MESIFRGRTRAGEGYQYADQGIRSADVCWFDALEVRREPNYIPISSNTTSPKVGSSLNHHDFSRINSISTNMTYHQGGGLDN